MTRIEEMRTVLARKFPTINFSHADAAEVVEAYRIMETSPETLEKVRADNAEAQARMVKRAEDLWRDENLRVKCARA